MVHCWSSDPNFAIASDTGRMHVSVGRRAGREAALSNTCETGGREGMTGQGTYVVMLGLT